MPGLFEVIEENIMKLEGVIGFVIYGSNGMVKHKYIPPSISISEMYELGREIVIMWDALRKSGLKEGMINWKYKNALIYMNSFQDGFLLVICRKECNETNLISILEKSTEYLMGTDFDYEDWITTVSEKKKIKNLEGKDKQEDNIDEIIQVIKETASKIAGPWIEYYFDGILESWLENGHRRKYRLNELVTSVSEYIDEDNARRKFIGECEKIT